MKAKLIMLIKAFHLWGLYIFLFGGHMKKRTKAPWVLGRAACLGTDTYRLLHTNLPLYNIQKGRVDYLVNVNKKTSGAKAIAKKIITYIKRDDIKDLIIQEQFAEFDFYTQPAMLYMDSYSELTDQLFVANDHTTSFCCNYSDVADNFKDAFTAEGLLKPENFEQHYRIFFSFFREKFGDIPIIFLHFPCKLDARQEFIARHHSIKETIANIHTDFMPFSIYEVPDEFVEHAPGDNFPYHYSQHTYGYLKNLINKNHFS